MKLSLNDDDSVRTVKDLPLVPTFVPADELPKVLEVGAANCSTCLFNFAATRTTVCDFRNCVKFPNLDQRTIPPHYNHLPCWSPDHRLCFTTVRKDRRFNDLQALFLEVTKDFICPWYLKPFVAIYNFIRWRNVSSVWMKRQAQLCCRPSSEPEDSCSAKR